MKNLTEMEFNFNVVAPEIGETVWIDIETRKVDAPDGWGYKKRWQCFMICIAAFDDSSNLRVTLLSGDEGMLMKRLEKRLEGYCQIEYNATRQFDEMILRGRFTNARRALKDEPGPWPNLNDCDFDWNNNWKELKGKEVNRTFDVESKLVPDNWKAGNKNIVRLHCLRDVLEMIAAKFDIDDFNDIMVDNNLGLKLFE
jgi:hypothetical protein